MIFKNRKNIFYVEIGIILLSGIGGLFALISVCFRGSWISQEYFDQVHMHRNRDHLTKCEASCWLAIIGTICCVTSSFIGALRMRYCNVKETKKYKTAQFINSIAGFISLLSSVSVWADFLCHLPYELSTTYQMNTLTFNQHKQPIKNRKILIPQSNSNQTIISTIFSLLHLSRNYSLSKLIKFKKNLNHLEHLHYNANYLFGWAYWFCVVSVVFLFLGNLIYLMRKDCEDERPVEIV
ncbi:unnamed protein product [Schistosoma spindalis]|nr:unnamed protein product [Schistosoma spindale]